LQAFHTASGMPVKIPFIKCPSPLPEIYTQSELDAIFTHAGEYTLLFRAFLQSGLRANEMAHLRPANLLARGLQVAPFGGWSPKSGQERTVVVPSALTTELRTAAKGATVFEMTMYAMLRRLKVTAKRAGLNPDNCWLHRFRANFATTLLRAGVDVRTVAGQLGHSTLTPTLRYLALLDEELSAKVEGIWK
jgi:integrase